MRKPEIENEKRMGERCLAEQLGLRVRVEEEKQQQQQQQNRQCWRVGNNIKKSRRPTKMTMERWLTRVDDDGSIKNEKKGWS